MSAKACEGEKPRKARRVLPDTPLRRNLSAWLTKSSRNFLVGALKSFCTLPILRINALTSGSVEFCSRSPAPCISEAGAIIFCSRVSSLVKASVLDNSTGARPSLLRMKLLILL